MSPHSFTSIISVETAKNCRLYARFVAETSHFVAKTANKTAISGAPIADNKTAFDSYFPSFRPVNMVLLANFHGKITAICPHLVRTLSAACPHPCPRSCKTA